MGILFRGFLVVTLSLFVGFCFKLVLLRLGGVASCTCDLLFGVVGIRWEGLILFANCWCGCALFVLGSFGGCAWWVSRVPWVFEFVGYVYFELTVIMWFY